MYGKTKISIIVPVFNTERWLEQCVESIMVQTHTDWELLLVDDGSTDHSGAICDRYAASDPRIQAFHKPNGGVSSARNLGLDHAQGEWIIVMDSDDYWHCNYALEKLLETATSNSVDIIRGEYRAVDQDENVLFERPICESKRHYQGKVIDSATFAKYMMCGEFFFVLCLVKRSVMEGIRYDETRSFLEDMKLMAELLAKPVKCMYIPLRFYSYRKLSSSASNQPKIKNLTDSFAMCDDFWHLSTKTEGELSRYYQYYSVMMYCWTLCTLAENPYYQIRNVVINEIGLKTLHKRTLQRLLIRKVFNKHLTSILLFPSIAIKIVRLKLKLITIIRYLNKNFKDNNE